MPSPDGSTRMLVAYDGSGQARKALAWAARFVAPEVTVISVVQTLGGSERIADAVDPAGGSSAHQIQLGEAVGVLSGLGIVPEVIAAAGNPAEEIIRAAEAGSFDLILVGSQGLNAIERFLLGAVSDRVARYAPCPVLVVR